MSKTTKSITLAAFATTLVACGGVETPEAGALAEGTTDETTVAAVAEDFAIRIPGSAKCVDVRDYSTSNGGLIQQWDCAFDANQLWRFTPVGAAGESVYEITSRWSGLALDVRDVSTSAGAPIQQWGYGGGNNQKFRVRPLTGGDVQLQAVHSGLCVSVARTRNFQDGVNGVALVQYTCSSSDWRQRFHVERRGRLARKALVVLLENGGYDGGLPFNPGMDVAIGLRFQCGSHTVDLGLGASITDAIRAAGLPRFDACLNPGNWSVSTRYQHFTAADLVQQYTDFAAEEIGAATIYASGLAAQYSTVRILQDGDLTLPRFRQELLSLAASSTIDVHVLAHGNASSFGPNGAITDVSLQQLNDIVGLTLRAVYQQNCDGSSLDDEWLAAGAQVVTGSAAINSMPTSYGSFARRFAAGETFQSAVQRSYDDSVAMYRLVYHFVDIYDEARAAPRATVEVSPTGSLSPDDELAGSVQIVAGNGNITR